MPTTIYLDHNIIRYLARSFPRGVDGLRERAAFDCIRQEHPAVRFVISHWNVIEAARGNDQARVRACAALIADLGALLIRDRSGMAREELRDYTCQRFFGSSPSGANMFYESYAQSLYDLGIRDASIVAHNVSGDILEAFEHPEWLAVIERQENALPEVLETLQAATHAGALTNDLSQETNRQWLLQFLPLRDPSGRTIPQDERDRMAITLTEEMSETYRKCPSLHVEHYLSEFRTRNASRVPERQDAIDLMHAVPAVAYCDAFISYDAYVNEGARYAANRTGSRCVVARLLTDAAVHLVI